MKIKQLKFNISTTTIFHLENSFNNIVINNDWGKKSFSWKKEKNYQKEKNESENGLKRTIWRCCIQLKMNWNFIEI